MKRLNILHIFGIKCKDNEKQIVSERKVVGNKYRSKEDIKNIGLVCCNCGSMKDVQYHHIVPLILGGRDIQSNKCCLCFGCHSLLHFGRKKNLNHSELTKIGIERAKKQGKQIGRKTGDAIISQKSITKKPEIIKYSRDFEGTLSDKECIEKLGLARNTYYKYKREIISDMNEAVVKKIDGIV